MRVAFLAFAIALPALGNEPGYVDPALCASCHRKAAEGYAKSGMARSFGVARAGSAAASAPVGKFRHAATEQDFEVLRRNGALELRRSVAGFDGKPADVLEVAMSYWIGSGNHARSYLSRSPEGRLTELPLTWYALGSKWAMSPGYDLPFHAGMSRTVTYGCLFCHAAYPNLPAGTEQHHAGWKLPEPAVEGVDCQRCHGPGQAHVDAAKQGQSAERVRAAIVNPKKLDARRGMDVCLQCHLETTTLQLPGSLGKYDRGIFSYRAGEPLQDFILHFEPAVDKEKNERVEFAGEAYRMRLSACFRESKGALTCMTCHNPHNIPRGPAATRAYAAVCDDCHRETVAKRVRAGQHPASRDCVSCHMPRRKAVDALNTSIADHFIRRRPDPEPAGVRRERNDSTTPAYRGEVRLYDSAELPETAEKELYLAVAQVRNRANLAEGLPRLEALVRELQPAQGEFYLDLADAWRQAGQPDKGVGYARLAVERMAGSWRAWFGLGNILAAAGEAAQAGDALKKAAALAPDEPAVWQALGEAYGKQGNFREAGAAFRSAIEADSGFAPAHNNAGTTLLRLGDIAGAEKELREAVRLRPESSAMQVNLATFLASHGGMAEARRRFALALKMNPEYAEGHALFGAALGAVREWAAARAQFEEAIRLNAKSAVTRHNLGVVLGELKDMDGAVREFEAALSIDPDYREAHLKLGRLLVQLGRGAEGEEHLRRAGAR